MVPRSGPLMIASERALDLKKRIVQLNPMLEGIAKPPMISAGRTLVRPMDRKMNAVQMEVGNIVRVVLQAWKRAESVGDAGPMVDALQNAAQRLKPVVNTLEDENRHREAEAIDEIIAEINRFIAGIKSGRIA